MITIKTLEEVEIMREGGRILAGIMESVKERVQIGVTTDDLDMVAENEIRKAGAKPAFKNYNGFPRTMCTSVNEEVVHGIPRSDKVLQEGDIITCDLGLIWRGFYLDMARTFPVGNVDSDTLHLVHTTKKALRLGIKKAKPGSTIGDIGNTIQRFVEDQGYQVVRDLCGHGIGKELHEAPNILNYGKRHTGETLKEGMVICIEPMVTVGNWDVQLQKDGQTFSTKDRSLSAHFEDTIAILHSGPMILTAA